MKKEISLVLPTAILIRKEIKPKYKLVFGLHYAYFKKGQSTWESNIEIAKRLSIHPNTIGNIHTLFEDNNMLIKQNGAYEVVKQTIEQLEKSDIGVEEIIIPYEVYSKQLSAGAMLLWGEYNRFRDTEKGYFVEREKTAKYLGSSIASITNWTKELDENGMLEQYDINYGRKGSQRIIRTKDFRKEEQQ